MHSQIGGDFLDIYVMDTNVHGELDVYGRLRAFGGQVDFSESPEVLVPTPDQVNEATNKAYVDSAVSAETAAERVASIASVQEISIKMNWTAMQLMQYCKRTLMPRHKLGRMQLIKRYLATLMRIL